VIEYALWKGLTTGVFTEKSCETEGFVDWNLTKKETK
jgi:hypothetical protein